MRRLTISIMVLALVATACGSGEEETDGSAPAQTTQASTTTVGISAPTTVADPDMASVTATIEGAGEPLAQAIIDLYTQALNPLQPDLQPLPDGLASQLANRTPRFGALSIEGSVATATVLGTDVAVYTSGEDVVLLTESGVGAWSVVGAKLASLDEDAWYGQGPRFLLVIGSDARPGQRVNGFRADSVHIISMAPGDGRGSILGIPRDTWVETSYGGNAKLTNTMASRGPQVVLDTVEMLTGIELEGYVITGFAGFTDLVDEFGGFGVDVPYGMSDVKSGAYFGAGEQVFDGTDALAFARNRTDTPGGDFGRSLNHGLLMLSALTATRDRGIEDLPTLLSILTSITETSLSPADLLTMAAAAYELDPEETINIVAPGFVGTAGAASVVRLRDEAFLLFEDILDGTIDDEY